MRAEAWRNFWPAVWRGLSQRLRPELEDLYCRSWQESLSLNLPAEFLESAHQMEIGFTIRWPIWRLGRARLISCAVRSARAAFELDVTDLKRGDGPNWVAEDKGWRVEQTLAGRLTRVRLWLEIDWLRGGREFCLRVPAQPQGRFEESCWFHALDETRARQLRLASVRADNRQLWFQTGEGWYAGEALCENSECLRPEFTLVGTAERQLLPPCETTLSLVQLEGNGQRTLAQQTLLLTDEPIHIRTLTVMLGEAKKHYPPGQYCLAVKLAGRELARFPFKVVSEREWLNQVKLCSVEVQAETPDGRWLGGTGALYWGRHVAFRVLLRFQTSIPSARHLLACTALIRHEDEVLHAEDFQLRLAQSTVELKMRRFELPPPGSPDHGKPYHLRLNVQLGNDQKLSLPIVVLAGERITNFEGQLTHDASKLPVNEEAYHAILARLNSKEAR